MADVTYTELEGLTYSELEELAYSLESTGSGESGSTGGSGSTGTGCLWTEERISAIEAKLADISSRISTLATVSGVWSYGSRTLTSSQSIDTSMLATSAEITALAGGRTLADLATPADIPTAEESAEAVWDADSRTLTAVGSSGIATASSLSKLKAVADGTADTVETMRGDLAKALGLIGYWTLSGSTLTAYDEAGAVLGTWTVTKSAEGKITGVRPNV